MVLYILLCEGEIFGMMFSSLERFGGGLNLGSSVHVAHGASYNLLVNFASLLEGYVRWDKKYLRGTAFPCFSPSRSRVVGFAPGTGEEEMLGNPGGAEYSRCWYTCTRP